MAATHLAEEATNESRVISRALRGMLGSAVFSSPVRLIPFVTILQHWRASGALAAAMDKFVLRYAPVLRSLSLPLSLSPSLPLSLSLLYISLSPLPPPK